MQSAPPLSAEDDVSLGRDLGFLLVWCLGYRKKTWVGKDGKVCLGFLVGLEVSAPPAVLGGGGGVRAGGGGWSGAGRLKVRGSMLCRSFGACFLLALWQSTVQVRIQGSSGQPKLPSDLNPKSRLRAVFFGRKFSI